MVFHVKRRAGEIRHFGCIDERIGNELKIRSCFAIRSWSSIFFRLHGYGVRFARTNVLFHQLSNHETSMIVPLIVVHHGVGVGHHGIDVVDGSRRLFQGAVCIHFSYVETQSFG
jgi:hypothetical protein